MSLFFTFSVFAGPLMFLFGCASTAEGIVKFANDTSPVLLQAYRQNGLDALAAVKCDHGPDDCDKATKAATDYVDSSWEPVWASWDALKAARDAYAEAKELGVPPDTETLERAYCAFLAILPEQYRSLLRMPLAVMRCV